MTKGSFHVITLGCPKNTVDSETMTALLKSAGYVGVEEPENADVVIVNTCCFIEPARAESINVILEAACLKQETGGFLVVAGCLPQRYKDEISKAIPEVDGWIGLEDESAIVGVIEKVLKGKKVKKYKKNAPLKYPILPRSYVTPDNYGYIKIADGCSHGCSFCAIPRIRGKYRSLPMEEIERQAQDLINSGRREIILIAQDTTLYGIDLYGKKMLPELLDRLSSIKNLHWLRLMYSYPDSLDDKTLAVMALRENICKYLDIPLQHSDPEVLKKMGRSIKHPRQIIEKIKKYMPDAVIRSSFITGHPGETEKRFLALADFIKEAEFYNLGVFAYSPEEGTESFGYKSKPSRKEAERRRDYLLSLQQEVSLRLRQKMIGKVIPAVCESLLNKAADGSDFIVEFEGSSPGTLAKIPPGTTAIGRTVNDAPEIDGLLYITGKPPDTGQYFKVKVKSAGFYDLLGKAFFGETLS